LENGLKKIFPNKSFLKEELNNNYQVLTEAVQIVLRLKNNIKAYDKVKELSRGKKMTKDEYLALLNKLGLKDNKKLKDLTPEKYLGLVKKLVEKS